MSWRDDIDLVCLEKFDSIECAELAAQYLQSAFQSSLAVMGLPEDLYDQIDKVIEPAVVRRMLGPS
jgi:hypothetical protein